MTFLAYILSIVSSEMERITLLIQSGFLQKQFISMLGIC
jgi:hypothetical protein